MSLKFTSSPHIEICTACAKPIPVRMNYFRDAEHAKICLDCFLNAAKWLGEYVELIKEVSSRLTAQEES